MTPFADLRCRPEVQIDAPLLHDCLAGDNELSLRRRIHDLLSMLGDAGYIVLPTTPFRAPLLDETEEQLDAKRYQMMRYFLLASYFGLPQISIPLPTQGAPLGLSLIGRRGGDRKLLALAQEFCATMQKAI